MTGRPSLYTEELALAICERIASGESLKAICQEPGIPNESTVLRWVRDNETFRQQYAQAREDQADADADLVSYVGQKAMKGEIDPAAARVAMDAFKWSAGKRNAKKYGDKVALEHSGNLTTQTEAELDARIARLCAQAGIVGAAGGEGTAESP